MAARPLDSRRRWLIRRVGVSAALCIAGTCCMLAQAGDVQAPRPGADARSALSPGSRVLLDAHNAYPEDGRHADRLERALTAGTPLAIEQDLVWFKDPVTGEGRSVVSHGAPLTGREPSLEDHFFRQVAPLIERALRETPRDQWPVLVLNLDFKTNEPEHHAAVWELLGRYESWLTTARRTSQTEPEPLEPGPLLVLTGEDDTQEQSFHDQAAIGRRLRLFGAVHTRTTRIGAADEAAVRAGKVLPDIRPGPRSNYRRWWNLAWSAVEAGGQRAAGDWTDEDERRLRTLVTRAHEAELWIRFYTLNGHDAADRSGGWTASYNFGSTRAARTRWEAAVHAGVDFVAVDQYESFAHTLSRLRAGSAPLARLDGVLTRADYETLFEREFEVPPGTERIDLDLFYDDSQRTVIDLGLRGPNGFRGWAGGGRQRVFVGSHSASFGYAPGPLEPGTWSVILGVPNIRPGVTTPYQVSIRRSDGSLGWPVKNDQAGWYAGDLHVHSGHSDGRTLTRAGERVRVPAQHVFNAASAIGLDFVALSDHNTTSHWADVDRLQALYPALLLLHAREVTTYRGHVNAFGERRFTDFRLGPGRPLHMLAAEVAATGALLSINHPQRPDDESCMGCGWNDRDDATIGALHAVEIVNGDLADGPQAGWAFWAQQLNRGHRLTAIGGSDEHSPDENSDQRLGRPTTMVYARELSELALIEGIRAGRVYVRTRGPEGPVLDLWASARARRFDLGDVVPVGPVVLHAAIRRGEHQTVEWVRNGSVVHRAPLPADGVVQHTVDAQTGDWFSLVVRDGRGPTLFSGAIYTAGQ